MAAVRAAARDLPGVVTLADGVKVPVFDAGDPPPAVRGRGSALDRALHQ
jgi:hypothetical protein